MREPIDYDFHRSQAHQLRAELLKQIAGTVRPVILDKRRVSAFVAALALATAAFWGVMLASPPTTEASQKPSRAGSPSRY